MQCFRRFFVFLIAVLVVAGCSSIKFSSDKNILRVLTYNIHHGEGVDGKIDIERIANLIREAKADIVALQEVDRGVERTKKIDIMTMLSDLTGMAYAFGKNIDYQGGDYGNGFLTRFPILEEKNLHYHMIRPKEQRGLLQLVLDVRGQEIALMNTHIDYRQDDSERVLNVGEIRETRKRYRPRPIVVCGDFNDVPTSRTVSVMKEDFIDSWEYLGSGNGFSYSTTEPVKRIDYIFVAKPASQATVRLQPVAAHVLKSDASDHLPVLVEFEITAK